MNSMNSWLDRSWLNRQPTQSRPTAKLPGTPMRSTPYSIERQKYRYGISESPSVKLNRWSKTFGGITKMKSSLNKSIFSDKPFLKSSIFEKQCSVKINPPKKSLLSYSMNINRSTSNLTDMSSPNRDVISTLKAFDNSKPSKRTCSELNEIFDLSGSVKKRRKMNAPITDSKAQTDESPESDPAAATITSVNNKSFWRDAALLASLSTSRQWLTEEMNKTISAGYNSDFIGQDGALTAASRCTTPDSVPGSDLSNSSTFQKSALSNSLGGVDSRPPSLMNYPLGSQGGYGTGSHHSQPQSLSSASFITAPYYVQPVKVILREVSTNTESDWNSSNSSEKQKVGQFSKKDIERDREIEEARVRRLMGLDEEEEQESTTGASENTLTLGTNNSFKPAPAVTSVTKSTSQPNTASGITFTPSASFSSKAPTEQKASESSEKTVSSGQTMMSSVAGKIAAPSVVNNLLTQNVAFGMSKEGSSVAAVSASKSAPVSATAAEVKKPNFSFTTPAANITSDLAKSTSSSLFGNMSFNSSVVPPKLSAAPSMFNLAPKPTETVAPNTKSETSITAPTTVPSFSLGTQPIGSLVHPSSGGTMATFKFGVQKCEQSDLPKSTAQSTFSFAPGMTNSQKSDSQTVLSTTATVSIAPTLPNFKFSPSTSAAKSVSFATFAASSTEKTETPKMATFSFSAPSNTAPSSIPSFVAPSATTAAVTSNIFGTPNIATSSSLPTLASNLFGQPPKSSTISLGPQSSAAIAGSSLFSQVLSAQPGSTTATITTPSIFGTGSVSSAGAAPFANISFTQTPVKTDANSQPAANTVSSLFGAPKSVTNATTAAVAPIFGSGFNSASSQQNPTSSGSVSFGGQSMFGGVNTTSQQPASQATSGMFKFGNTASNAPVSSTTFTFGGNNLTSQSTASNSMFGSGSTTTNAFPNFQIKTSQAAIATPFGGAATAGSQVSSIFGSSATNSTSGGTSGAAPNIFGSNPITSNATVPAFGAQTNIFGSGTSTAKPTAPLFGTGAATASFPNTTAPQTNSGSLFGNGSAVSSQPAPVFGQASAPTSSSANGPSFVFGQPGTAGNQTAPAFNFGGGSQSNMTFGSGAQNGTSAVASPAQQPGMVATAPGAFSVGINPNDSSLPNRRIRTASRKTKAGSRK